MLALGAPIRDEFPGRLPPTLHLPSILLFNFWVTDEPWFPGTYSPRSLAYLNKLPTAYQEKFGSIHSLREHPALESPDFRHSRRRRQRYKVALIGTQYPSISMAKSLAALYSRSSDPSYPTCRSCITGTYLSAYDAIQI